MGSRKKAQAAFEYLMIFGVVLLFVIPIWLYVSSMERQTGSQLALSYAQSAVSQIADSADLVYSQGYPAKVRIRIYVPDSVLYSNVTGTTVNFGMLSETGYNDIYATSEATLNGTLPTSSGNYWINIEAMSGYVQITPE